MATPKPQAGSESMAAGAVQKGDGEAPQDLKMALYTHGRLIPSLGDAKLTRPMIPEFIRKKFDYDKHYFAPMAARVSVLNCGLKENLLDIHIFRNTGNTGVPKDAFTKVLKTQLINNS